MTTPVCWPAAWPILVRCSNGLAITADGGVADHHHHHHHHYHRSMAWPRRLLDRDDFVAEKSALSIRLHGRFGSMAEYDGVAAAVFWSPLQCPVRFNVLAATVEMMFCLGQTSSH
jgi:hypothetical protein